MLHAKNHLKVSALPYPQQQSEIGMFHCCVVLPHKVGWVAYCTLLASHFELLCILLAVNVFAYSCSFLMLCMYLQIQACTQVGAGWGWGES